MRSQRDDRSFPYIYNGTHTHSCVHTHTLVCSGTIKSFIFPFGDGLILKFSWPHQQPSWSWITGVHHHTQPRIYISTLTVLVKACTWLQTALSLQALSAELYTQLHGTQQPIRGTQHQTRGPRNLSSPFGRDTHSHRTLSNWVCLTGIAQQSF